MAGAGQGPRKLRGKGQNRLPEITAIRARPPLVEHIALTVQREAAVFRVIVGAPPFYQPADGRTLGTGQLPGVHSSVPGLRANLARSPLDFQQPVAEAYAGRPVPVGARGAEGAAPGLWPAFRNRPGDLLHQPFQWVVGEIHSSPPPSSASASPSSSQGGLSSYSSSGSGISSYSPPSS